MPTSDNANKTREQQATQTINGAVEQARTPFLAALGAGDVAAQTVLDSLNKIRGQVNAGAESARSGVPQDFSDLRERLDPAELRKKVDSYTKSAVEFYGYLAERGEGAIERLRAQPQVKQAEQRVETAVGDARELADDVLGKVTSATRSYGEKAARKTEQAAAGAAETVTEAADDAAENIKEAGAQASSATRSTTRKAASKTAQTRTATSSGTSKQSKSNSSKSS